jgi:hypothetical protein
MSLGEQEIERIVQEVVRRLSAMLATPAVQQQTLVISAKLVTVADLKGKLAGIQRVEVPQRTVITPAAKDFLKDSGVQLCVSAK